MSKVSRLFGWRTKAKAQKTSELAVELSAFDRETIALARPFTMTSTQRLQALILATRYVVKRRIPGAVVECGVWRGGSMLTAARTLREAGDIERTLYLYDTFEGMPAPGEQDVRHFDHAPAASLLATDTRDDGTRAIAGIDIVQRAMEISQYPKNRVRMIAGKVEDTIPNTIPDKIALLRLDTDWYASTRHELQHLYPLLEPGGVLIIDDYGWWEGARRAVDEYFANNDAAPLFNVIDDTGRIAVRT
jgi:predicted O-methyltransferase YrrM